MTDIIHEHAGNGRDNAPPAPPQEQPALDEKTGEKRVYGYIFILFIVAFSLLLWAFFMSQRGTDQVLSELRGNANALQTTLERNVELEKRADELQAALDGLAEEKAALEKSAKENQEAVDMLNESVSGLMVNRELCYALLLMNDGDLQGAADTLASWNNTADYLEQIEANDNGTWSDGEPPILLRERYEAMIEQLVKEGYLTIAADGHLKSWHVDTSDQK